MPSFAVAGHAFLAIPASGRFAGSARLPVILVIGAGSDTTATPSAVRLSTSFAYVLPRMPEGAAFGAYGNGLGFLTLVHLSGLRQL
jgi:hypothetical protein